MKYITYVGSYTDKTHPEGIRVFESDAATGDFRQLDSVCGPESPTYMAFNRDFTRMYTVLGRAAFGPRGRNGGIAAFKVDGAKLTLLNEIPTGWTIPCHIALAPSEKTVVYAEYSCGTAGFAELREDGSIDPAFAGRPNEVNPRFQVQHVGDGPNKPRQDKAHAHCTVVTPDGKYQMVVDLTLDQVKAYDFANRGSGMKEVPSATIHTAPLGSGPRHIVFHPNGRLAFVIHELGNRVSSYRYDGATFTHAGTYDLLPKDFTAFSKAAAVKISEDGTQVFCSNRGHDSITVFNLDVDSGKLELLNNSRLDGQFPRDFEFMPGGKFCLAGLKESWRVASYAYDAKTGKFDFVKKMDGVYRPLFFKFHV